MPSYSLTPLEIKLMLESTRYVARGVEAFLAGEEYEGRFSPMSGLCCSLTRARMDMRQLAYTGHNDISTVLCKTHTTMDFITEQWAEKNRTRLDHGKLFPIDGRGEYTQVTRYEDMVKQNKVPEDYTGPRSFWDSEYNGGINLKRRLSLLDFHLKTLEAL